MWRRFKILVLVNLLIITGLAAGEIDEEQLFSQEIITNVPEMVNNKESKDEIIPLKTSISGKLSAVADYSTTKDFVFKGFKDERENELGSILTGNFNVNTRLTKEVKGYVDFQVDYSNKSTTASINVKEMFTDINFDRKVYIRAGKQNLQWGRGYFWNPTNMMALDKKSLNKEYGSRAGNYGIKTTKPTKNGTIYNFVDIGNSSKLSETAIATKYEQTIGNTEISISNWYKNGYNSVFGADISSRIWGVDIRGEATISKGENKGSVVVKEDHLTVEKNENRIVPKISAGFTKYFDFLDEKERISLTGEYYYNGDGYSDNILEDKKEYTVGYLKLTKKEYLLKNNLMESNNFSRQYIAAFIIYNKFLNNDTTLTINAITNLVDLGTRTTIFVENNFTDNVILGGSVTSVFGQADSEYMVSNIPGKSADNISLQTSIEIKF